MIDSKQLQEIIDDQYQLDVPIEIVKLITNTKFIVDIIQEKYPKLKYCDQTVDNYVYQYSPSCSFMCSKYLILQLRTYEIYISNCQKSTLGNYGLYVKITMSNDSLFSIDLGDLKKYTKDKNIQITDNYDNIIDLPISIHEEKGVLEDFKIGPSINEIRLHGDFDLGHQFSQVCKIPCLIYGIILDNVKGDICSCCNTVYKKILNKILYI